VSSEIVAAPRLVLRSQVVEELSERRHEPDWLRAVRLRAFDAFERLPMPDQRTEGWRRTSLRGLSLDSFNPLPVHETRSSLSDGRFAEQAGAALFAYRDGTPVQQDSSAGGVRVLDLQQALDEPHLAARIQKHFASVVAPDVDKLVALHYALFNAAAVVFVPRGANIERPVWLSYNFDQSDHAALAHTLVIVEDEAEVRLVEDFRGAPYMSSGVVEQVVGANAHLRYVHLQRFSPEVWNFSTQRALLGQDASLRTLNVVVGGRLARNTIQVVLEGRGGQADLLGIAASNGRQHVDFETLQEHFGNNTRSDLVIHNALRDHSSANFTGLIRINKSAHQTESSQEQKNILLSDHSRADSDPKLEIQNNDVIRCTHGAAVGPVDQEMVFYLQSRGLDKTTAEQLIVEGFFQSTLRKLDLPAVEAAVWSAIAEHQTLVESSVA
jgi:Fe-S cluster assembly protein SufD